jgi:hypothetical protein
METENISGDCIGLGRGVLTPANINKIISELNGFRETIKMNIVISLARDKRLKALDADIYKFQYDLKNNTESLIRVVEKHLHDFIVLTELSEENTPERTKLIESLHGDRMLLKGMI